MLRSDTALTALLALGLTTGLACAHGDMEVQRESSPSYDMGVGATVLMPGQTIPMDRGARSGGNLTFLGGASSEEQRRAKQVSKPGRLFGKEALKAPGAVLGAPLAPAVKGIEAMRSKGGESQSQSSTGAPGSGAGQATPAPGAVAAQPHPSDPHAALESARLSDLERELASRGAGGLSGAPPLPLPLPVPAPATSAPSQPQQLASRTPMTGRELSIADELAVLQAAIPPKARPEELAGVRTAKAPAPPKRGGVADQVADRNGDGRPDHWIYRHAGRKVRELFDEDADSAPDRTVYFDPGTGKEQSVEEDTNLDGRLDSWIEYRDGQMARQRRDTDYDGFLDTWTFYRGGSIAREEQDLNGDGFRNRMAFYEQGRLVREREDQNGDGRVDRVTLYDDQERVLQRDEDQDGDGLIDTRSYYEAGRLSRRELVEDTLRESVDRETLTEPVWSSGPQEES